MTGEEIIPIPLIQILPITASAATPLPHNIKDPVVKGVPIGASDPKGSSATTPLLTLPTEKSLEQLKEAIEKGDLDGVKQIWNDCYDNPQTNFGHYNTPLAYAVKLGKVEIVEFLVNENCALDNPRLSGAIFPLRALMTYHDDVEIAKQMAQIFINKDLRVTSRGLFMAIRYNNKSMFDFLLKQEIDLNQLRDHEKSLLHEAAYCGRVDMVKALVNKKVYINEQDKDGDTALHRAVYKQHLGVIELLLDSGADKEICNKEGKKPVDNIEKSKVESNLQDQCEEYYSNLNKIYDLKRAGLQDSIITIDVLQETNKNIRLDIDRLNTQLLKYQNIQKQIKELFKKYSGDHQENQVNEYEDVDIFYTPPVNAEPIQLGGW